LIDVPRTDYPLNADDMLQFALAGLVYDTNPSPPPSDVLFSILRHVRLDTAASILDCCQESSLIPPGAITADELDIALRLYRQHIDLARSYRPRVIRSPVTLWWASSIPRSHQWSSLTLSAVTERLVGGTHHSVMRPPLIDQIASDMT
jgi:hypothetical protein